MNQETREALSFVIGEMNQRLVALRENRRLAHTKLEEIDGEIAELNRRLESIKQDMSA